MTRDNNAIGGEVMATIAFVVIGKAKKDTLCNTSSVTNLLSTSVKASGDLAKRVFEF